MNFAFCQHGGQAAAFLRIPVGARAVSMGNAFTAIANDASSYYWNPGALISVDKSNFTFESKQYSFDRTFYNTSLLMKMGGGGIAVYSWRKFAVENIDGRNESGQKIKAFDDSENVFTITYTLPIYANIGFGGNIKFIQQGFDIYHGKGMSYDIGIFFSHNFASLYKLNYKFGLSILDIGGQIKWRKSNSLEKIPQIIRVGNAVTYSYSFADFTISTDLSKVQREELLIMSGLEIILFKYYSIRMGWYDSYFRYGLGMKYKNIKLDYGMLEDHITKGNISNINLTIII